MNITKLSILDQRLSYTYMYLLHWKPDIRSPFVQEKNGLICDPYSGQIACFGSWKVLSLIISDLVLYPRDFPVYIKDEQS